MRLILSAILLSLLCAAPAHAAIIWSSSRQIVRAYPHNDGMMFLIDGEVIGGTCSNSTQTWMQVSKTDANYDAKVSAILLAFSGQYLVTLAYDDTTLANCAVSVDRLQMIPN